jgi:hypothetical protein
MSLRAVLHLLLHLLAPALAARLFWSAHWRRAWLIMLATMLVDLDHLLAEPLYDPNRCSIGFHPLHTAPAIALYAGLAAWPRTRVAGTGLLIHMALDAGDCALMPAAPPR